MQAGLVNDALRLIYRHFLFRRIVALFPCRLRSGHCLRWSDWSSGSYLLVILSLVTSSKQTFAFILFSIFKLEVKLEKRCLFDSYPMCKMRWEIHEMGPRIRGVTIYADWINIDNLTIKNGSD